MHDLWLDLLVGTPANVLMLAKKNLLSACYYYYYYSTSRLHVGQHTDTKRHGARIIIVLRTYVHDSDSNHLSGVLIKTELSLHCLLI